MRYIKVASAVVPSRHEAALFSKYLLGDKSFPKKDGKHYTQEYPLWGIHANRELDDLTLTWTRDDYHDADLVFLPGGGDVDPARYNGDASMCYGQDIDAERWEMEYLKTILDDTDIPVLGICRGSQALYVTRGGGFCEDLRKRLNIHHNSLHPAEACTAFHPEGLKMINSTHHQGGYADSPPEGATVIFHHRGIAEATVYDDRILGIQWHPEWMWSRNICEVQRGLFRALMEKNLLSHIEEV